MSSSSLPSCSPCSFVLRLKNKRSAKNEHDHYFPFLTWNLRLPYDLSPDLSINHICKFLSNCFSPHFSLDWIRMIPRFPERFSFSVFYLIFCIVLIVVCV